MYPAPHVTDEYLDAVYKRSFMKQTKNKRYRFVAKTMYGMQITPFFTNERAVLDYFKSLGEKVEWIERIDKSEIV